MLSGRSDLGEVMLLAFDDLRDKPLSVPAETESRERTEGVPDEMVFDREPFPNIEVLFMCSV